jgi:protein required for attachment to host cells
MKLRVVVADEGEARFYDAVRHDTRLSEVGRVLNPKARLHDRDLKSDRPGRVFASATTGTGRRGAVAHHAVGGESRPRKHEAQLFARQIVHELELARNEGRFERIVLMAGPAFLGLLRQALPKALRALVAAEVPKDLLHQDDKAVLAHLPREAFDSQA